MYENFKVEASDEKIQISRLWFWIVIFLNIWFFFYILQNHLSFQDSMLQFFLSFLHRPWISTHDLAKEKSYWDTRITVHGTGTNCCQRWCKARQEVLLGKACNNKTCSGKLLDRMMIRCLTLSMIAHSYLMKIKYVKQMRLAELRKAKRRNNRKQWATRRSWTYSRRPIVTAPRVSREGLRSFGTIGRSPIEYYTVFNWFYRIQRLAAQILG